MKASLMVAVMVLSMVSICFVGLSSEEASADGSKVILGENSDKPYYLDKGDSNGKTVSIEFNESAFSSNAIISFYEPNTGGYYAVGGDAKNVDGVDVKIEDANPNARDGCYTVNFKGTVLSNNVVNINIILSIIDVFNGEMLPMQTYVFVAYVKVVSNTGNTISVSGAGVTNPSGSTQTYGLSFNYEDNAEMNLRVKDSSSSDVSGYVFYADGLPSGISVTRDANGYLIGGKVAANYTTTNGSGTIYAVSQAGKVVSQAFTWTLAEIHVGTIKIMIGDSSGSSEVTNGYVFKTVGDNVPTLTVAPSSNDYAVSSVKVSIAGGTPVDASGGILLAIPNSQGTYPSTYKGTGAFTVTISADIGPSTSNNLNVKTVSVVETITVYVVSSIVDADLDPVVSSN